MLSEELKSQKFTGRIVTEFNLSMINRDPSKDIILQPGDKIVIPSLSNTVFMFGEYQNPSTLLYRPNLKLKGLRSHDRWLKGYRFKRTTSNRS